MIIVLTGLARSGKTFASNYLKKKGFTVITFSSILKEECKKRGLEPNKMNLSKLGDELRKKYGMGALGKIVVEKITSENVILDGSRSPEEIYEIRKKFPDAMVVYIKADPDVRFSRRNEMDPKTKEEFFARDERDIKNKGLSKVIEMADITIENNGTLEEFEKSLDELVDGLQEFDEYSNLGVKIGIEIHQRLDTHKLFCSCSSDQKEDYYMSVSRALHSTRGELGKTDNAVKFESSKHKKFVYRVYPTESCLVELDEEPPHDINKDALKTVAQFCKLVGADIVDEIHVMRKMVVDGSNTTGFQRTALVGMNGHIRSSLGDVHIPTICLEEEACRIENRAESAVFYKLNGLGIPLIEIATDPSIKTPKHAREVAEGIGFLLRSLNVQRGIGSIRQDINISIRGGARVEIKGFQNLNDMEKIIDNEITRQKNLVEIMEELRGKEIHAGKIIDATDIFSSCSVGFLRKIVSSGEKIYASKISGLKGFLKRSLGAHTLGKELAFYAMVYGPKGIIHNDEDLEKYGLVKEFAQLKKILSANEDDIIFIVGGRGAKEASEAVLKRAEALPTMVPEETRAVFGLDTKYMRPLPGKHRMYPETDIPPIVIDDEILNVEIPKTLDEYERELAGKIGRELAHTLVKSKDFKRFLAISKKVDDIKTLATILTNTFKELRRDGFDISLSDDDIATIVNYVESGKLSKSSVKDAILSFSKGDRNIEKLFSIGGKELEKKIKEIVDKNPDKSAKAIMGMVMKELGGRVNGKDAYEIIRRIKGEW